MKRRDWIAGASSLAAFAAGSARQPDRSAADAVAGTLRVAFATAETGFDPVAIGDVNSNRVASCIFEAPLRYDYLARPARIVPNTAVALPEISPDFRRYTFRIRPGILYADDPVFGGRPRELTAADYVYSIKRYYDPRLASENLYLFEGAGLLGLSELRRDALRDRRGGHNNLELALQPRT